MWIVTLFAFVHSCIVSSAYLFLALVAVAVWFYVKSRMRVVIPDKPLKPLPDGRLRHVVITGCGSGFGRATALRIAITPGYYVHALCRRQDSADALAAEGVAR